MEQKSNQLYYLYYECETLRQVLYADYRELCAAEKVNRTMIEHYFDTRDEQLYITPQFVVQRLML